VLSKTQNLDIESGKKLFTEALARGIFPPESEAILSFRSWGQGLIVDIRASNRVKRARILGPLEAKYAFFVMHLVRAR